MIKIEQNTTLLTSSEFKEKISGKNSEFSKTLAKVEQFKKDLEELGPLRLAFKLNMDKIKEKIPNYEVKKYLILGTVCITNLKYKDIKILRMNNYYYYINKIDIHLYMIL